MQIKGTAVKSIKEFVEKQYPQGFKNWLQQLPEDSKKIYATSIDVSQWYSVQYAAIEPTRIMGKLFFDNNELKAAFESGRFSAQQALTGVYKVFVMIASPAYIIERASRIMTSYYQPSSIIVKEKQPKFCKVQIDKLPDKNPIIEMRIAGWISKAFEVTGCSGVKVETPKSLSKGDAYTEIVIKWQ